MENSVENMRKSKSDMEKSVDTEIRAIGNPLMLSWLGIPLITYTDRPLRFRTRKSVALLVYLTTEGGTHSRDKLTTLFWPESNSSKGRGMLRTTLAHLREGLESIETAYLNIEHQTISFNFDSNFVLDLHLVKSGLDAIQAQPTPAERKQLIHQLQKVVISYRSDFVEGFSLADAPDFDDWVTLQREVWHSRMNQIFAALSQWQFEAGDLNGALETATRWRSHDHFGEEAPLRLMQLQFANNNRVAALEVYDDYAKMLDVEFGGKPTPEMRTLAARVRTSTPVRRPQEAPSFALTSDDLSFVGRLEEFARLAAAYQAASHGQTQVLVVTGEAGIGKTRLAAEFLKWARAQGANILPGRAFETGGEVPYQPVAQILRHYLNQESEPANWLSTTWLAELSLLLPELRERLPNLPQPQLEATTSQNRLLESIARLGQALAEATPLLIFLDDIQWADMPSLDALHYAMLRWADHKCPILLLLCARDLSTTPKNNLRQWLTGLKAKLPVTYINLAPLNIDDTVALISSLEAGNDWPSHPTSEVESHTVGEKLLSTNSSPFNAFAQALVAETGGHPFYLVETIKSLLEQKVLIPYRSAEGDQGLKWITLDGENRGHFPLPRTIPNSVREAVLDRLSRLTPAAATMLTAAAVLGQAATFKQLAEMAGIEQLSGVDALEELVVKHLLIDAGQSGQSYIVAHDKMRDVIYGECSPVRRQVLHSRAVTAMQGSDPARLAFHALVAGMDAEAFHYSVIAGDAALHLFAASEAVTHYETARNLGKAGQLTNADNANVRHLYVNLGRALELSSRFEEAGAIYEELKVLADQRVSPALKLTALQAQVILWSMISYSANPVQGEVVTQEALLLALELNDRVAETQILWGLMKLHILANRLQEAIDCGDRALALARELNLREQTAFILNDMGTCYGVNGRLERAEQAHQEAGELWRELDNLPMLADSLAGCASYARWSGNYDRAVKLSAEAYKLSSAIDNVWGQSYSQLTTGYVFWDQGQPAQALAVMEECIQQAKTANYLLPQILTRADLGALYASLGNLQRGIEVMQLALDLANTHLPLFRVYVSGLMARIYVRYNHLSEAEALITQWKQDSNQRPFSFIFQWLYVAEAELAFNQGNFERALALIELFLEAFAESGLRSVTHELLYLQGQCLVAIGRENAGRTTLLMARAEAERLGSRRMLMQILPELAALERDPVQAEQLLQQAEAYKAYIVSHSPPELHAFR